jgi:hypothetical protein
MQKAEGKEIFAVEIPVVKTPEEKHTDLLARIAELECENAAEVRDWHRHYGAIVADLRHRINAARAALECKRRIRAFAAVAPDGMVWEPSIRRRNEGEVKAAISGDDRWSALAAAGWRVVPVTIVWSEEDGDADE